MLIRPLRKPVAVGENLMLMAQAELGASEDPQLLVSAKSPDAAICRFAAGEPPVFASTATLRRLVVERRWLGKLRVLGATLKEDAGCARALPARSSPQTTRDRPSLECLAKTQSSRRIVCFDYVVSSEANHYGEIP